MITPERRAFLESAQYYTLNTMKYTVKPDWDEMEEVLILRWLYILEDFNRLKEEEKLYVQEVIKCMENRICIPGSTPPETLMKVVSSSSKCKCNGLTCNC